MSPDAPADTPKTVSRSTLSFLSGTFLSRLAGFGRDLSMAVAFGSNPAIAAFMVAYRFANLIRRLFGEGPLASGFVPYFEQVRAQSPAEGAKFFRDLFFSLSLLLIVVIGGFEGVLWALLKWGHFEPASAQILYLTALMLPGILFICLFGLSSSYLQCERKFFLTGFAPVAFNVVWMAAVFFLKDREPSLAVVGLSIAVIAAFWIQWGMLLPKTFSHLKAHLTWKEVFSPSLFSSQLREMVRPLLYGMVGIGAVQINSTLDAIFARCASLEGPAYLWYAIRIEQLPLALFGIALSSALLPPLSRALKDGSLDRYLHLLRFALRRSFSLIFPCTLGIFTLGIAGINFLYGHGGFTVHATYETAMCLWGYGFGLLPSVFVLLLAPAFYASKEFKVPMAASMLSVGVNIALNSLFVFGLGWGAFSIAIATGISAWVNFFYLVYALEKKLGHTLFDRLVWGSFLKTGPAALIAAVGTLLVGKFFVGDPTLSLFLGESGALLSRDFTGQALEFIALSGTFLLLFFSYARLFHASDVLELIGIKQENVT